MLINRLALKLGLVRFATSLLFILLANVLNRVLVVDLLVPATLVTFSFAFQHVMTPVGLLTGYVSDTYAVTGRHRAPYIWGGMLLSLAVMPFFPAWALALGNDPRSRLLLFQGIVLFSLFGVGTTVSATAINALLVDRIPEADRGSAMTFLWILTLAGFMAGSALISLLYPHHDAASLRRLFTVVTLLALVITVWGSWGLESRGGLRPSRRTQQVGLWRTLRFLGSNPQSLAFFLFLMASIFFLALKTFILTPFGGEVLALPVAATSKFGIYMTYGILLGMLSLHLLLGERARHGCKAILLVSLTMGGLAFGVLSLTSFSPNPEWGLYALWLLGLSRGLYNVGLSHLTMGMAHPVFSGIFMGLWNLMSGLALAAGEMAGGVLKDWLGELTGSASGAYGWLFLLEGVGLWCCLLLLLPINGAAYQGALKHLLEGRQTLPAALTDPAGGSGHESP